MQGIKIEEGKKFTFFKKYRNKIYVREKLNVHEEFFKNINVFLDKCKQGKKNE